MPGPNPYLNTAFYGREDDPKEYPNGNRELWDLRASLRAAKDSGLAPLLFAQGSAGVGKSRLLTEFVARAPDDGCGAVYVSLFECGRTNVASQLIRQIAKSLLELDPRHRAQKPSSLRPGFRRVAQGTVDLVDSVPGSLLTTASGNIALKLGAKALKALVKAADESESQGNTPPPDTLALCDHLRTINTSLNRRKKEKPAIAIVIDQWDDCIRLLDEEQEQLRETLSIIVSRLNENPRGQRRIMFCLGVRKERVEHCLHAGGQGLEHFNIKPLRRDVAAQIVRQPEGEDQEADKYFTQEAATALADKFCHGVGGLAEGDLAGLLAVAAGALEQAQDQWPIDAERLDPLVEGGVAALVDRAQSRFRDYTSTDKPEACEPFIAALARSDDWTMIDPTELETACGGEVDRATVIEWLKWWTLQTPLIAGDIAQRFRFRHETYLTALQEALEGGLAEPLRRARTFTRAALYYVERTPPDFEGFARNLSEVPNDLWAHLPRDLERVIDAAIGGLDEESDSVREGAAQALSTIGDPAAKALAAKALPALIDALGDDSGDVRKMAALALGRVGKHATEAVPALIQALRDESVGVRWGAAVAMALNTTGEHRICAVPALITALDDESEDVRGMAATALGNIGQPVAKVVPSLVGVLCDESEDVRRRAAEAVGKMGQYATEAVPALVKALYDSHHAVRAWAAWALGEMGEPAAKAVPDLLQALRDPNQLVRLRTANTLGALAEFISSAEETIQALISGLDGGNDRVRAEVAHALGHFDWRATRAVPALIGALRDPSRNVRSAAAQALGQIGEPAVPALIAALSGDSQPTRVGAAIALREIGEPAVPALIAALSSESEGVCSMAATVLRQIGDPRGLQAIEDAKKEGRL